MTPDALEKEEVRDESTAESTLGAAPLARSPAVRSGRGAALLAAIGLGLTTGALAAALRSGDLRLLVAAGGIVIAAGALAWRARGLSRRLRETEQRLLESERLAAIGLATAGFAHELKNGMMVAHGFAELALRTAAKELGLDAKLVAQLREVEGQTGRLTADLRSFLRLAHGGAEVSQRRPLREVLAEVETLARPLARLKGHAFESAVAPGLAGAVEDPALRSGLLNLVLNAVEFARTTVSLSARQDGAWVVVTVEDDGAGVPHALVPRLFERFATGRTGGTGLGLAAAKEAVEGEGGTVTYTPGPAGGARFTVRLPTPG